MQIDSQKKRIHKDTWFQENIEDLSMREILSCDDTQTILHESILEYFTETITLEQLIMIALLIQKRIDKNDELLIQKLVSLSQLSQYLLDEEENSEIIYQTLTKVLTTLKLNHQL